MDYNVKKLLKRIDDYFVGTISKTELGEWANRAYYDLLKGGYVENEKIVVYPFVKMISTFHLKESDKDDIFPCAEENVKKIQDILHGKKNFEFSVEMSIPIQVYSMFKERYYFDEERRKKFSKLRDILQCNFEQRVVFSEEKAAQIESIMCLKYQDKTVLDLLERYVLRYLNILFKNSSVELGLQKNMKLYAQKSEQNIMEERLLRYLDCYIGSRNFQLLITYEKGEPEIFIVV